MTETFAQKCWSKQSYESEVTLRSMARKRLQKRQKIEGPGDWRLFRSQLSTIGLNSTVEVLEFSSLPMALVAHDPIIFGFTFIIPFANDPQGTKQRNVSATTRVWLHFTSIALFNNAITKDHGNGSEEMVIRKKSTSRLVRKLRQTPCQTKKLLHLTPLSLGTFPSRNYGLRMPILRVSRTQSQSNQNYGDMQSSLHSRPPGVPLSLVRISSHTKFL